MWIPKNKRTRVEYPAISDAEKKVYESDPMLKGRYTFRPAPAESTPNNVNIVPGGRAPKKEKAPDPVEAERVKDIDPEDEK